MSRHTVTIKKSDTYEGGTLAYGFDPVPFPGYFCQIFMPGKDQAVFDCDTRPGMAELKATRTDIAQLLEAHGAPEEHVNNVVIDRPI